MDITYRDEWGAAPPIAAMRPASYPMSMLWVHHSVTNPTDDPHADARVVQQIGFSSNGQDTSYTLLVHPDGTALEGRDIAYVGAHTYGLNGSSLAICLIGNYDTTEPTEAQVATVRRLCAELVEEGYLTPGIYPTGGHRDAPDNSTACPGRYAYARLDDMRALTTEDDDMASPEVIALLTEVRDQLTGIGRTLGCVCGPLGVPNGDELHGGGDVVTGAIRVGQLLDDVATEHGIERPTQ